MSWWILISRSLRYHFRAHVGTILGAAVGTAILAGALLVGDSVRGSLKEMALARLGKIDSAIASGDRLFRSELGSELSGSINSHTASLLQLLGTASNPDTKMRANKVQVLGVDSNFWAFGEIPSPLDLPGDSVALNRPLADHLNAKTGDTVLVRVPKVSALSRDAPLSPEEDSSVAMRLKVAAIIDEKQLGFFSMQANQIPPFNAFVNMTMLQRQANATNQANLLLVANSNPTALSPLTPQVIRQHFQLADAQLDLKQLTNQPTAELRTSRVFMETSTADAALEANTNGFPIFTYFVNELRVNDRATPYSMVTGMGAPVVPETMRHDEIMINAWLAEDLGAKPGDTLQLKYYVVGLMRDLVEKTNSFTIRGVLPMELPAADPTLMPDFPGLANADNCRDWDTGFPIDTAAIRDKDERYWDSFRGTPKAFVTFAAAQQMWTNRFGSLTSVRFPMAAGAERAALANQITYKLNPGNYGLVALPVREQALAASSQSQDFGQLFLGFSFFLIIAALLLMSLLFRFALEQRGVEIGTMMAMGFTGKQVRNLLMKEGLILAAIGSLIGLVGAIFYAKAMVYGLGTIWREAVGRATLSYHARPSTLALGCIAGALVAALTIWWSLRKEGRKQARELLNEGLKEGVVAAPAASGKKSWFSSGKIALATGIPGLAIAVWGMVQGENARADLFFGAGALILVAGLAIVSSLIKRLQTSSAAAQLSVSGMGMRSVTRQPRRSRATVGLLACGAFLIASIGAFRLDAEKDADKPTSGTGGFEYIGETALPVTQNLNSEAGATYFNFDQETSKAQYVQFRVKEGEDASCLNLNRAQRPRLLGVAAASLQNRFQIAAVLKGRSASEGWGLLNQKFEDGAIPVIGDAASVKYALGLGLGDTLEYVTEQGSRAKLRIIATVGNSILQGSLIMSEQNFVQIFPSESGYRMFLIDTSSKPSEAFEQKLVRALQDSGLELAVAKDRLAAFNAVQNTYLGTFQILGGLGLLLGSVGLGVVLLRNVFERRNEFALLQAVGFRKAALKQLVLSEHLALLLLGLMVGVLAAAVAILPSLIHPRGELPIASLGLTLGGVLVLGVIWTLMAATLALRSRLIEALRNE
ncbi:MAG: FtsX-like permease family protein [Verrucomicrobiales bacterium]